MFDVPTGRRWRSPVGISFHSISRISNQWGWQALSEAHRRQALAPAWNVNPGFFLWWTPARRYCRCQAPFFCASGFPVSCTVCPSEFSGGGVGAYRVPAVSPGWAQCLAHVAAEQNVHTTWSGKWWYAGPWNTDPKHLNRLQQWVKSILSQ